MFVPMRTPAVFAQAGVCLTASHLLAGHDLPLPRQQFRYQVGGDIPIVLVPRGPAMRLHVAITSVPAGGTGMVSTGIGAARPLSDEEEYYVGRAVAARITSTYPLYRNKRLTDYLNLIGQTIALHTEKPTTFGGYHFALLDSPEINAFACPGGIILITRGMLSWIPWDPGDGLAIQMFVLRGTGQARGAVSLFMSLLMRSPPPCAGTSRTRREPAPAEAGGCAGRALPAGRTGR